jgi:hypothetical protein
MTVRVLLLVAVCLSWTLGCSSQPKASHLSGKVTFKNQPVPAGWISFTPDVAAGGRGKVKTLQIKDGVFDSSKDEPTNKDEPAGLYPGPCLIKIAGFDGKQIPFWGQGKQIFNPVEDKFTVPEGSSTKDWVIPESAGQNVKFYKTADG